VPYTSLTTSPEVPAPERGPIAPPFAFPVIDRLLRARPARVLAVDPLTPTVVRLVLSRPPGYRFRAGQFALLRLATSQGQDMRPLSLAGPPDADTLEFATRAGTSAYKQAVLRLAPGDEVKVSRPLGAFRYDHERPAVLIAGGLGITPLRSVLLQLQQLQQLQQDDSVPSAPVSLLFSNRDAAEIPFRDELSELAQRHPNLKITWVVTSPISPLPAGTAHRGHIDGSLLRVHADEVPDALFYVSGSPSMVADTVAELGRLGISRRRIRKVAQGRR
jgi:ferredoxin-NADP reductase